MDAKVERIVTIARLEREHGCPIWETKEGDLIPISKMAHTHLENAHRVMCEAAWEARSEKRFYEMFTKAAKLDQEMHRRPYPYDHTIFDRLMTMHPEDIVNDNRLDCNPSDYEEEFGWDPIYGD